MGWLSRLFSAPWKAARKTVRVIRAGYDAARTTDENRNHWVHADGLSANAELSPGERQIMRNRTRYESKNNCYAAGLVRTVANDLIGTGPTLQISAPEPWDASSLETAWREWARKIKLARKLRCMRQSLSRDGEAFAVMFTNPKIDFPIQLDIRLIEADRVTTPGFIGPNAVDGIIFDEYGNPETYHILKYHPGDTAVGWSMEKDDVPAEYVIHWFRLERAEQQRGAPIMAPANSVFSRLRRYTLAVLGAAEFAASQTGVIESEANAEEIDQEGEAFDAVEIERNMLTTLPRGYRLSQMKAEQPTTTYAEFKHELIDEAARCENVPSNIAHGNSSAYNYASGRLDNQMFGRSQDVDHSEVEQEVLDRLYAAFVDEAALAGVVPAGFPPLAECTHEWFWGGREHVDPAKEANAQATRLALRTTTYAKECAKNGEDWERVFRQAAREQALMKQLGIVPEHVAAAMAANAADAAQPDEPAIAPPTSRQPVGARNG